MQVLAEQYQLVVTKVEFDTTGYGNDGARKGRKITGLTEVTIPDEDADPPFSQKKSVKIESVVNLPLEIRPPVPGDTLVLTVAVIPED